ncbi:MAG: hypothetical protein MRERV_83c005 [Mycoplasmataceae bacterium RV_VA103A]|nr:MAG: hypothetical protein MRERV_83c005 [Mycoplasmataceae bacterium RV_VA103A]
MNNQQLVGSILEAKKTKVYNHWPNCSPPTCQSGCRYHKPLHKLKVKIEHKPIKSISVFTDKLVQPDKILPVLESSKFVDKRYRFICSNYYGNYQLIDWEELPSKDPP